jgi:hypothetical protein
MSVTDARELDLILASSDEKFQDFSYSDETLQECHHIQMDS